MAGALLGLAVSVQAAEADALNPASPGETVAGAVQKIKETAKAPPVAKAEVAAKANPKPVEVKLKVPQAEPPPKVSAVKPKPAEPAAAKPKVEPPVKVSAVKPAAEPVSPVKTAKAAEQTAPVTKRVEKATRRPSAATKPRVENPKVTAPDVTVPRAITSAEPVEPKVAALSKKAVATAREQVAAVPKPTVESPEVAVPAVKVPAVKVPDLAVPGVKVPGAKLPAVKVPVVSVPRVTVPEVVVPPPAPPVALPDLLLPPVTLPPISVPPVIPAELAAPRTVLPPLGAPAVTFPPAGTPVATGPDHDRPGAGIPSALTPASSILPAAATPDAAKATDRPLLLLALGAALEVTVDIAHALDPTTLGTLGGLALMVGLGAAATGSVGSASPAWAASAVAPLVSGFLSADTLRRFRRTTRQSGSRVPRQPGFAPD